MPLQCLLSCASKYASCALQPVTRKAGTPSAWIRQDSVHWMLIVNVSLNWCCCRAAPPKKEASRANTNQQVLSASVVYILQAVPPEAPRGTTCMSAARWQFVAWVHCLL